MSYDDFIQADIRKQKLARVQPALNEVVAEYTRATSLYSKHNSAHEGYAVLLEELDELWDEVKKSPKNRNPQAMRAEAVQVAAMALRFLTDCC